MRHHRLANILATVTVISLGIVVLFGLVSDPGTATADLTGFLLRLVSVIAAVAVLAGVFNLIAVHMGRFVRSEHGWPYSLITLLVAVAVGVLRILDRADIWSGDLKGEQMSERVFESVQVSLESALAAMLVFFLVYAVFRLMRRRVTIWHALFSLTVVIVLAGSIPIEGSTRLADLREWLVRVPVSAGARGILIGVGLGTVTVGVRVLIGQDRAFRG